MRRRSRLLTLTALAASACSTAPSPDSALATDDNVSADGVSEVGRFRGELSVYTPFTPGDAVGDSTPVSIEPGTYTGEIGQFRRGRLEIDFDSSALDTLTVALGDDASDFPRGGGRFSFPPAEHNLAYTIAGEYFVEDAVLGTYTWSRICTELISEQVCYAVDSEATGQNQECYTRVVEAVGLQEMQRQSVRRAEDLSVRFVDPQTAALVAHYFGSNEARVETRERAVGICILRR